MRRFLVLVLVVVALSAHADRRRAVRGPASDCTFVLIPSFDVVPGEGLTRGLIRVGPSLAACTAWNAYSEADWVTIETSEATYEAFVSVAPNPTQTARSATLRIAGVAFTIQQETASVVISPPTDPNLLKNPTFNTDTANWGWEDRFPNGSGTASWTAVDANASIASGSILLHNTRTGHAFQQFQCVDVKPGTIYTWGGAIRGSSSSTGAGVFAFVEYPSAGCAGTLTLYTQRNVFVETALVWQRQTYTTKTRKDTHSVQFLIASAATASAPFDAWFDDLFLRE